MPRYGGASPYPLPYGGGAAQPNRPLLHVVWESLANQRGSAYDQVWPPRTLVGIENMAFARAITYDLYGANTRLANNFLPSKMTAEGGLLPRWERIFDVPPLPGDAEPTRRARVATAFARVGQPNSVQPFLDLVQAALGPLYVDVSHQTPATAVSWWPGLSGTTAAITSAGSPPNQAAVTGLTGATVSGVPSSALRQTLTLANCANAANNGALMIMSVDSTSAVHVLNPSAVAPDYGIGGTISAPTIEWSATYGSQFWSTTIDLIDIQVDPTVAGYHNADGSVNGVFWAALQTCSAQLDAMLPSWVTWAFWSPSPRNPGNMGFFLDDINNLDREVFGH